MNAGKQSFFRVLLRRILSSSVPVDGGYVFDLHGRWRYEARPVSQPLLGVAGTCL